MFFRIFLQICGMEIDISCFADNTIDPDFLLK